jgi:hypothetical protein
MDEAHREIKVADIRFGYDNSDLIKKMGERGQILNKNGTKEDAVKKE